MAKDLNSATDGAARSDGNKYRSMKEDNNTYSNPFSYSNEIIKKIPLIGQNFSYAKQTKEDQVKIEKRWTTTVKKIEIPVSYEEIYIDGKRIDSYAEREVGRTFSIIKNKIKNIIVRSKDQELRQNSSDTLKVKYYDASNPLMGERQNFESNRSSPSSPEKRNQKLENVMTVWGEEIVINKRKVKLGEFVIKKYEVTESKKVEIELTTEKLTIHHPNASKEEIM
jgi:stress response protein YsnF